jgi:hypothetical protein
MCVLRRGASGDRTICGRETRFPTSPGMLAAYFEGMSLKMSSAMPALEHDALLVCHRIADANPI